MADGTGVSASSATRKTQNVQAPATASDTADKLNHQSKPVRQRVRVLQPEQLDPATAQGLCRTVDAAASITQLGGCMSRGKLQDLLYFAQAWHLVWDYELLFPDSLRVTDNGILIESIELLAGDDFTVTPGTLRKGNANRLSQSQQRTLVGVVRFYRKLNHYRLSEQIRDHTPWQSARAAADGTEPAYIDPHELFRYYRKA